MRLLSGLGVLSASDLGMHVAHSATVMPLKRIFGTPGGMRSYFFPGLYYPLLRVTRFCQVPGVNNAL